MSSVKKSLSGRQSTVLAVLAAGEAAGVTLRDFRVKRLVNSLKGQAKQIGIVIAAPTTTANNVSKDVYSAAKYYSSWVESTAIPEIDTSGTVKKTTRERPASARRISR